ncbi:MAG TPA: hypothetical protein PKZ75_12575 [Bacteroidia bacterium]|nr:hypothetical protein [Bacteroidia bacterium]
MKYLLHIFLFCSLLSLAQNSNNESLIVVHYDEANKANLGQLIYRYNFEDNAYTGREQIMAIAGKKNGKDYVRCDVGENTLYKDRYLISGIGNVIDLNEKKVLHDGTAKFVRCSNDSIIFFTNDIFKGKYYSYFDLKTNTYSEIKSLTFKAISGQTVEFDRRTSPYKLEYFPTGKPKVLLMENAGHGGVTATDKKTEIPIYWIDDNTFLFPNIKITDLEGTIVKYNLTTSAAKTLGTFSSVSKIPATYKLVKGRNSFVEFYFKEKLYILNPLKETMLISNYKEIDSNYSIEVEAKAKGRSIYYKGAEIGKHHFALNTFKVGTNYSAFLKEIVMGDESYQQGLSVYVTGIGKWQNIATIDIASVVGWIK